MAFLFDFFLFFFFRLGDGFCSSASRMPRVRIASAAEFRPESKPREREIADDGASIGGSRKRERTRHFRIGMYSFARPWNPQCTCILYYKVYKSFHKWSERDFLLILLFGKKKLVLDIIQTVIIHLGWLHRSIPLARPSVVPPSPVPRKGLPEISHPDTWRRASGLPPLPLPPRHPPSPGGNRCIRSRHARRESADVACTDWPSRGSGISSQH